MPLDPNYPAERLRYMLDDASPTLIMTHSDFRVTLPATNTEVIEIDTTLKEIVTYVDKNLPATELGLTPNNLVYVIYTSGSTGKTKGHWHGPSLHGQSYQLASQQQSLWVRRAACAAIRRTQF